MLDPQMPDPILVTRPAQLQQMAEDLLQKSIVAVDTESNSLYAYREQVCLVQFSTTRTDYLVDPLILADLSPLADLFASPEIEKVFHAAEYDLICLKRDYGFEFNHLFDTMTAARILGREAVGLGSILEAEFGITLNKRYQRANWGQRPLPPDLLAYARLDTHYLIALRERLWQALEAQKLWPLAQEDFQRLRLVNGHPLEELSQTCWRIHGANDLAPQQAAVLQELCLYRERVARSMDRPVFKVINDQTLLDIARLCPGDLSQLSRIHGMNEGQIRRHGYRILDAVRRGLSSAPLYPPRQQRPNEAYLQRVEALRRWRRNAGEEMGVNSDIVLPRDLLFSLAEKYPQTRDELAVVMQETPWRLAHFGDQILDVIIRSNKKRPV
jgi:ribonuclease D